MKLLLICSGMGSPVGIFLALLIASQAKTKIGYVFSFLISAIIISFLLGGAFYLDEKIDTDNWNNGKCSYCGGSLEFKNASRYKSTTIYYWECEECGYIVETKHNMRNF